MRRAWIAKRRLLSSQTTCSSSCTIGHYCRPLSTFPSTARTTTCTTSLKTKPSRDNNNSLEQRFCFSSSAAEELKAGSILEQIKKDTKEDKSMLAPLDKTKFDSFDSFAPLESSTAPHYQDDDNNEEGEKAASSTANRVYSEEHYRQQAVRDMYTKLKAQKGRVWSDPLEVTDEEWAQVDLIGLEDLEDWTPDQVGHTSKAKVRLYDVRVAGEQVTTVAERERAALAAAKAAPEKPQVSQEASSAQLSKEGLPTLEMLTQSLPPLPPPPVPPPTTDRKAYNTHQKSLQRQSIRRQVRQFARPHLPTIYTTKHHAEKQILIDELFQTVEDSIREAQGVLKVHRHHVRMENRSGHVHDPRTRWRYIKPPYALLEEMVEEELSGYLQEVNAWQMRAWEEAQQGAHADETGDEKDHDKSNNNNNKEEFDRMLPPEPEETPALPLFIDLEQSNTRQFNSELLPQTGGVGYIVEEWGLCASRDERKRVMLRDCMKQVADIMVACGGEGNDGRKKVLLTGERGVGKSTAMTTLVSLARESNWLVLFLPHGHRYRQNYGYIEPSPTQPGLYDVPLLAQEACDQLLQAHASQLDACHMCVEVNVEGVDWETLEKIVKEEKKREEEEASELVDAGLDVVIDEADKRAAEEAVPGKNVNWEEELPLWAPSKEWISKDLLLQAYQEAKEEEEETTTTRLKIPLTTLLQRAVENVNHASACYSAVLHTLLHQRQLPLAVFLDEYNCYYDKSLYYHYSYDKQVETPIPYELTTLLRPLLVVGTKRTRTESVFNEEKGRDEVVLVTPEAQAPMARGCLIASLTHTRAVPKEQTKQLLQDVKLEEETEVVEVPRFSVVEVEHQLANYEACGMGKLRMDGGETVDDEQEVAFLRMVSGGIGHKLLDACII